jgi:hypothetical protein
MRACVKPAKKSPVSNKKYVAAAGYIYLAKKKERLIVVSTVEIEVKYSTGIKDLAKTLATLKRKNRMRSKSVSESQLGEEQHKWLYQ